MVTHDVKVMRMVGNIYNSVQISERISPGSVRILVVYTIYICC